jgi:AbrB family looped-hinge helix DNA binding protein
MSPHGQITIPKKAREQLKLKSGDVIAFYADDEGRLFLQKG